MRYSIITTASVASIMQRARQAFGDRGLGLRQTSVSILETTFSGAIGTVTVEVRPLGQGINEVVVASHEVDGDVRRFVMTLPRESLVRQSVRRIREKIRPSTRP